MSVDKRLVIEDGGQYRLYDIVNRSVCAECKGRLEWTKCSNISGTFYHAFCCAKSYYATAHDYKIEIIGANHGIL